MKKAVGLFAAIAVMSGAFGATELVRNGSFEETNGRGDGPAEWDLAPARWCTDEKDGHFARLVQSEPGAMPMVYREFDLPAETASVRLAANVRVSGLLLGAQNWNDARIICRFKTAGGECDAGPVYMNGDTRGWEARAATFAAPADVKKFVMMYSLFQCKAGVFDLDDLSAVALDANESKAAEKAARTATGVAKWNPPEKSLTAKDMLHAKGNKVVNAAGENVLLQGVNIPSLEWSVNGENLEDSFGAAIADWKVNCIRFAVRSDFWFGEGREEWNKQDDGGAAYRARVEHWIDYSNKRGVWIVLDLHEYKAATPKHVKFWNDAAKRYANRPGVIFELLNEPHDISWREWRDGGALKDGGGTAAAENDRAKDVVTSVGMQALVNAIRGTGAKNMIVAGGLDWAYDARGFLEGYALDDRGGNGYMVSVHCYPWKSGWADMFLEAAEKFPIFVGEVGSQPFPMPWEKQATDEYVWSPDMIGCIQQHKLHWAAFSFHPGASPCLIQDWSFKPTPGWGSFVKAALRGAQIRTGRMH